MNARMKFRKYGVMKFVGHLDLLRYFQKALRRAHIPVAYTKGYSPHMILSFAQPLGLGMTSDGEYLDLELTRPIDGAAAVRALNETSVEGIEVLALVSIPDEKKQSGMAIVTAADYRVSLLASASDSEKTLEIPKAWRDAVDDFLLQDEIVVRKQTKRSEKEVDIRPLIYRMEEEQDGFSMRLSCGSLRHVKPELVMDAFLTFLGAEKNDYAFHYHRVDLLAEKGDSLVPLIHLGKEMKV